MRSTLKGSSTNFTHLSVFTGRAACDLINCHVTSLSGCTALWVMYSTGLHCTLILYFTNYGQFGDSRAFFYCFFSSSFSKPVAYITHSATTTVLQLHWGTLLKYFHCFALLYLHFTTFQRQLLNLSLNYIYLTTVILQIKFNSTIINK